MTWGLVATTVVTAGSAAYQGRQARNAASAGAAGADAATAESARQFDQTRADFAPYRTTGTGALNQLARLFGLPSTTSEQFQSQQDTLVGDAMLPAGTTHRAGANGSYDIFFNGQHIGRTVRGGANGRFVADDGVNINALRQQGQQQAAPQAGAPDMSAFLQSPGYQFRRDEGTRGLERTAAARGGAFSGNALRALSEFNSGLASQEFGNYFNQLAGIAGIGQTSTNQTAAYGADHAANAGRNALYAGDARASGIIGQANAYGQGMQDLGLLGGYYLNNRKKQQGGG